MTERLKVIRHSVAALSLAVGVGGELILQRSLLLFKALAVLQQQ